MKCPTCGKTVSRFYKCGKCGDVRCNSPSTGGCAATSGPFKKSGQGAVRNQLCHMCKKGRYQEIK